MDKVRRIDEGHEKQRPPIMAFDPGYQQARAVRREEIPSQAPSPEELLMRKRREIGEIVD